MKFRQMKAFIRSSFNFLFYTNLLAACMSIKDSLYSVMPIESTFLFFFSNSSDLRCSILDIKYKPFLLFFLFLTTSQRSHLHYLLNCVHLSLASPFSSSVLLAVFISSSRFRSTRSISTILFLNIHSFTFTRFRHNCSSNLMYSFFTPHPTSYASNRTISCYHISTH